MEILIRPTEKKDLPLVKALWADGDVMKFVGFPEGLVQTDEEMARWYDWVLKNSPLSMHYSIFEGEVYCGETWYSIDTVHDNLTSLDIKLFVKARGRGIASKALNFAIEQARLKGAKKVWVNPVPQNEKAIKLYKRLGFSASKVPEHILKKEGEDGYIYMEKELR